MATRRFCDICDKPLTNADVQPLVREFEYRQRGADGEILPDVADKEPVKNKVVAYVEITNQNNKPLTDICMGCKLRIVTDGKATTKPVPTSIATLQPQVSVDRQPPVALFRAGEEPSSLLSEIPPTIQKPEPSITFEPSLPGDRPTREHG